MLQRGVAEVAHGHFHQDFCIGTVHTPTGESCVVPNGGKKTTPVMVRELALAHARGVPAMVGEILN